jgi:predicted site-specific integrase-resolvase
MQNKEYKQLKRKTFQGRRVRVIIMQHRNIYQKVLFTYVEIITSGRNNNIVSIFQFFKYNSLFLDEIKEKTKKFKMKE